MAARRIKRQCGLSFRAVFVATEDILIVVEHLDHAVVGHGVGIDIERRTGLAFRRGVDVGGDITRPGFRLDSLYGSKADATAHIENLAAHVMEKNDSSAYFLLA